MDRASTVPQLVPRSSPEPNPHFVFPLQPQDDAPSTFDYPSQLLESDTLTHRTDRTRPQRLVIHSLPAFEFNPSSSSNVENASPTRSRTRQRLPSPYHSLSAHRRNGSEFIGGNGESGGEGLLSTSPVKGDGVLTLPRNTQTEHSSARRGHVHRRSGAVSNHDLSDIIKLTRESQGSSLPTTPCELRQDGKFPPFLTRSTSQPEVSSASQDLPSELHLNENDSPRTQSRTRVGFSDTIEVIPRSLSTISSDTSSSLSTIHASHSVSGSVTSILSSGASSLPQIRLPRSLTNLPCETEEAQTRLGTAEPRSSNEVTESIKHLSSTVHAQRCSLGTRQKSRGPKSDDPIDLTSSSNRPTTMRDLIFDRSIERGCNDLVDIGPDTAEVALQQKKTATRVVRPRSSPESTASKRQRKVTSWAGSILSRKAPFILPAENLFHSTTPTTPSRAFAPSYDLLDDISFDEDTTCVIRDPSQIPTASQAQSVEFSVGTQDHNTNSDDAQGPMFDLDAALRAEPANDTIEGFFPAKRRMHSSGALGRFSGQGVRYHRRAESAPEMAPIDYHTFGFLRLGSNPKMADVFEEDEEQQDQENDACKDDNTLRTLSIIPANDKEEASTGLAVGAPEVATVGDEVLQSERLHHMVPAQPTPKVVRLPCASPWNLASVDSVHEVARGDEPSVEIVEADEEPRSLSVKQALEDSSAPAPPSDPSILTLPKLRGPYLTPETLSSAVPSPDFNRTSFDVPRLHTAASSNTDWVTGSSGQAGDHGPSLRGSVDDVPSLTSSASTMIGAQPPRMSSGMYSSSSAQRSSSLSVAIPHPRRPTTATKRSSLASLSRLVGSSSADRSKSNLEEHASPETVGKVDKRRGTRISRMMRFWKSKERRSS